MASERDSEHGAALRERRVAERFLGFHRAVEEGTESAPSGKIVKKDIKVSSLCSLPLVLVIGLS